MTSRTIDLNRRKTIPVPSGWKGQAFIMWTTETMIIKKTESPNIRNIRQHLKLLKGKFKSSDIEKEIRAYRKGR